MHVTRLEESKSPVGGILDNTVSLATLGRRVAARMLDATSVLELTLLPMPSVGDLPRDLIGIRVLLISAFVVSAVYEIAGVGAFGQILAKRMLGQRDNGSLHGCPTH